MPRSISSTFLTEEIAAYRFGLTRRIIAEAIAYTQQTVNIIDNTLLNEGLERLGGLVELANLSSILGNLFRKGIVRASNGQFAENGPHKYPDILGVAEGCEDIEIKVALENNKPKGHLVKPGPHLLVRYCLLGEDETYTRGKENRGQIPFIWEVRLGTLINAHFNVSNTEGDSGKTAVVNAAGMAACRIVYCDLDIAPLSDGAITKLRLEMGSRLRSF
jgi:hypothetical protein